MRRAPLPFAEFVVLVALLFSLIAFGTDAMLPAFPAIARDLGLEDANRAQLVLSAFVFGTGAGQLLTGPLSDALGRKPVISFGILLFIAACLMAYLAQTLESMLLARFIQGVGISAPRTVALAMVRDLHSGRMMARVMSVAMAIFVLVPAVAPLIGQALFLAFGWRSIFLAFILFAGLALVWLNLRQPETLPPEARRRFRPSSLLAALAEVLANRVTMRCTLVLSLVFGALFAYLSSAQQVFVDTYGKGTAFPAYFAGIALISGGAGFINAALVLRLGMRAMVVTALALLLAGSLPMAGLLWSGGLRAGPEFGAFLAWSVLLFFVAGLTIGNLNALAMEPMGHIAGMASAIIGATATMLAMAVAVPVGLAFDGSALPLVAGTSLAGMAALGLMLTGPARKRAPGRK